MEMPELNEDLLGGESNTETLNPAANSVTLSESEIQSENKVSENVEEVTEKVESSKPFFTIICTHFIRIF